MPHVERGEEGWKHGGSGDDGDEEGELVELVLAVVVGPDPRVSIIYVFSGDFIGSRGRSGKVVWKGRFVDNGTERLEIDMFDVPLGVAV